MILFDYLYYLCCRFYLRNKDEQDLDTWRISGVILVSALTLLLILSILIIIDIVFHYKMNLDPIISAILTVVLLLIFFGIRYTKFASYKDIATKVKMYSSTKIWILDIGVALYLLFGLPTFFILAYMRDHTTVFL